LAGFIIFPGTFTSIQSIDVDDPTRSGAEKWILGRVKNVPLLVIAGTCCVIGAAGMIWLWYRWHNNFIWLVNRIFLFVTFSLATPPADFLLCARPGTLHGLAGEISTIVNVFSQQRGKFSTTALVTAIVTGACTTVCGVLVLFYSNWKLERVKKVHHRTLGTEELWDGPADAGIVERTKRRGNELEPEPGVTV
jgi:energy-converting hydrogenase Eha subunit C